MEVKFGYFAKDKDSTVQPPADFGDLITDCKFKEPTSMTHPVFIVKSTRQYNYAKMSGRYYFVNEVVRLTNEISEYHCTVDALATWKTAIGSSTQYVTRSRYVSDPYLIDSLFPMKNKKTTSSTILSTLHTKMWDTLGGGWYMLGTFGRGGESGGITYYCLTPGQFRSFCQDLFDISQYSISIEEVSYGLQKALINPIQYIASVYWFPTTEKPSGILENQISYGFWNSSVSGFRVPASQRMLTFTSGSVEMPEHPKRSTAGYYLNGAPFTRRTLYCYMFGTIPLDTMYFINSYDLHVTIGLDSFTGDATLIVSDGSGNMLDKRFARMGVNVPIAQIMPDVLGGITSVAGSVGSLLSGNIVGGLSGVANAAGSLMPQVSNTGSQGSIVSYSRPAVVVNEFYDIAEFDRDKYGFPLCKPHQISNLNGGYCKVENPHIEIAGTRDEMDMIEAAMEKGFYYE